ncbi:MAG: hypothetical protein LBE95_00700, partial [Holosporaceae bacterium]|nr:hypothetical protein [Holosporaceae bacterium]
FDPDKTITIRDESFWEEMTITSALKIKNEPIPRGAFIDDDLKNIGVVVSVAEGEKCERCWKISTALSGDKVCERCRQVLAQAQSF